MKNMFIIILLFGLSCSSNAQTYGWYSVPGAPHLGRYDDINFIHDSIAWVGKRDTIYKTTDRGDNWSVVYAGNTGRFDFIRSIDFVNDTLGFAGCLAPPDSNHVFVSKDGGVSWSPIDSLIPGPLNGICGIDHKDNMIVGVGSVNFPPYVIISKDYGQTWTYQALDSLNGFLVDCFIIDSLNILISGSSTAATNTKGNILRSNDGGLTWNQVAISNFSSTYCWKIFMQDNGIGVAANEAFTQGLFFKTIDGGNTWQEYPLSGSTVVHAGGIAVINDTIMFTGNQQNVGMAYSTDGGIAWQNINVGHSVNRIYVFNDNTAIASGSTIYKYHPNSVLTSLPELDSPQHGFELRSNDNKHFILHVNLVHKTKLMVELFTMDGKYITQPINSFYSKGEYLFELPTSTLAVGGYFIRIRTYENVAGVTFIKM